MDNTPERRLSGVERMAHAVVAHAYDHEYGFNPSVRCKVCGAVGRTDQIHGGPPVKRGDIPHKGACAVALAETVLWAATKPHTEGGE